MKGVKINKQAQSITFINNGIAFSQFGIANEILDLIENQDKEIKRLNNIINELEKYLEKIIIDGGTRGSMTFWYKQIYDYLQELKGSGNNE